MRIFRCSVILLWRFTASRLVKVVSLENNMNDNMLLSRHEMAAAVCRRDGGVIVAHVHRALRGSIPTSQTFTALCLSVYFSGAGKRTAVFRSVCSVKYSPPRLCTTTAISWREISYPEYSQNCNLRLKSDTCSSWAVYVICAASTTV